ncbi:type I-E CRISPR-associated protein Cas6/Cse3/CasE [Gallaecimonas xiamenensis]|uniref:CRISPR-associated Cse3 family protein n=1 Tax=Gallaecimonas xiamenensis 3-C-1 TaxID=745411 RepID=K2JML9_9GAMM|nr:type I-E CRISPR-associated protein Cas6/Cse3/CasE [Gallaecimonas xiamenensis]EKE71709.1 hypothetical protein B3C1_12259 [Gallaecimonas xiamenensis 3-C-1]
MYLSRVTFKPDIAENTQLTKVLEANTYGYHQLLWDLFAQKKRDFLYRAEFAQEQLPDRSAVRAQPLFYVLSKTKPAADSPLFRVESKAFSPELTAGKRLNFRLRANPVVTKNGKRHDLVMDEQVAFSQRIVSALGEVPAERKAELRLQLSQPKLQARLQDWLQTYLHNSRYFAVSEQLATAKLLELATQEAVSRRLQQWLCQNPSREGIASIATHLVEDEMSEQACEVASFQWQAYQAHSIAPKGPKAQFRSVDMQGELVVNEPERFLEMLIKGIGPAKGFGCGLMLVKTASM